MTTQKYDRWAEVPPALERRDAIAARLQEIIAGERACGGNLPPGELAEKFAAQITKYRESRGNLLASRIERGAVLRFDQSPTPGRDLFGLLCFLFPDMEQRARLAVAQLEYTAGPPAAQRTETMTRLVAERVKLIDEDASLTDKLIEIGVEAEHLVETRIYRDQQEAERQANAAALEKQKAAAAKLDEQPRRPVQDGSDGEDLPVVLRGA